MSNPQNALFSLSQQRGGGYAPIIFAATVNNADPAALTDANLSTLSIDTAGRLRALMTPASGVTFSVVPSQIGDDLAARATVAAPGVGGVLVSIAAPPAGTYECQATVFFVVVGAVNNAEFREGATVVSVLQMPAVVSQIPLVHSFRRALDGATAISINATAADGAGTYSAMLIARRIA